MRISIFSVDPAMGHVAGLAIGLRTYGNVTAVYNSKGKHGCGYIDNKAIYGIDKLPQKGDVLIIVGCVSYDMLIKMYRPRMMRKIIAGYHRVIIIVTDGGFMRTPGYYNRIFRNYELFCTPCKIQFADGPAKEYYQPIGDLKFIQRTKTPHLSLSHAPFSNGKQKEKGSTFIISEFKRTGLKYNIISGKSWTEALKEKAKSHIHVDQVSHYDGAKYGWRGGVGKNGYEAMVLGCCTLSWGKHQGIQLPPPPVVWCEKNTLRDALKKVITDEAYRAEVTNMQLEWSKNYLTYDFAARWVLGI